MGKFDGVLICTDLDGTLLKKDKTISEENLKAIEYFKREGGFFTIVTGRMPFYVTYIADTVRPNAPFGCINGGGLYDWDKKEYIFKEPLSSRVFEMLKCASEHFPQIGMQVTTFDKIYFCQENGTMEHFRSVTGVKNLPCHYKEVKEPIAKILFGSDSDEELVALEAMMTAHPFAKEFELIRSDKTLFEILPKGMSKGTSIEKLCDYLALDQKKTIAIGDYNNDIPMFRTAHIAVAVANACKDAKNAADLVTVSNEENAIAKVIWDLDAGKIVI